MQQFGNMKTLKEGQTLVRACPVLGKNEEIKDVLFTCTQGDLKQIESLRKQFRAYIGRPYSEWL